MDKKTKFLIQNIGFHFEDLSLVRQLELEAIKERLNLTDTWIYLALSKDSLESWEKWGFNLFQKPEFKSEINSLVKVFERMDEEKISKTRKNQKNQKKLWVSEKTFKYCWEGVAAQGQLYTHQDAASRNLSNYWSYSEALKPEAKEYIDTIIATGIEPQEEDWLEFVAAVVHVKI